MRALQPVRRGLSRGNAGEKQPQQSEHPRQANINATKFHAQYMEERKNPSATADSGSFADVRVAHRSTAHQATMLRGLKTHLRLGMTQKPPSNGPSLGFALYVLFGLLPVVWAQSRRARAGEDNQLQVSSVQPSSGCT